MTKDYGIKVTIPGKDTSSSDVRDILLSSKYPMLKYHSDDTVNLTIPTGNTSGFVDVTHNLGYVPAFIAYSQHTWSESFQRELPFGRSPQPLVETAFATNSIVRIRVNMTVQLVDRDFSFRVIIFKDQIA